MNGSNGIRFLAGSFGALSGDGLSLRQTRENWASGWLWEADRWMRRYRRKSCIDEYKVIKDNCNRGMAVLLRPWYKFHLYSIRLPGDCCDETGMTALVKVVDSGSDAPGTIIEECSEVFSRWFDKADLVISKGQGNYSETGNNDRQQKRLKIKGQSNYRPFLHRVSCSLPMLRPI